MPNIVVIATEARLVAKRELDGSDEIHDADAWAMIEKQSKALGHPIVIMRAGKIVVVPPEEIEV